MFASPDSYHIGHEIIDSHHAELFHLVSSLDSVIQTHRRESVDEIISFLEKYVLEHFLEEETVMKEANYEGYEYHVREHEIFRMRVFEIRKFYSNNAPSTHLIFNIRRFVDRLVDHILTVDCGIAEIMGNHEKA
jgi:hemerythrin-like metal-binding protein